MSIRVLIVEDFIPAREALRHLLESVGGFRVVCSAGSEMDATEWLATNPSAWDVAILDLMIEGGSGFNLIRRAKQSTEAGKAVVFSAYATPVVADRCRQLGADAAFDKNEMDDLLSYLEALKVQGLRAPEPGLSRAS